MDPFPILKLTWSTAVKVPNRLVSLSHSIITSPDIRGSLDCLTEVKPATAKKASLNQRPHEMLPVRNGIGIIAG